MMTKESEVKFNSTLAKWAKDIASVIFNQSEVIAAVAGRTSCIPIC